MTSLQPIARVAARVLLLDARDRLLLFRGHDPATPAVTYWFTVGGGLEPGEDPRAGAVRETREETGLRLDAADLIGPVWRDVDEFPFEGRVYRQQQEFYVARVDAWDVDTSGFEAAERRSVSGQHWWTLAVLRSTAEQVYPVGIAALVARVLAGEVP
jgi:8-oxo-dGTP pyrophosphatase MutT (NUDIX family)